MEAFEPRECYPGNDAVVALGRYRAMLAATASRDGGDRVWHPRDAV